MQLNRVLALSATAAVCAACASQQTPPAAPSDLLAAIVAPEDATDSAWFCPMHPDVTATTSGSCPKCGMKLLSGNPFDTREYGLELTTTPPAIEPGVPFVMRLAVHDPTTGALVRDYEDVHEKKYHLFVISEDLSVFEHVHPAQAEDGSWNIELTLPKAGYYRVLSDFVAKGGSPQLIARQLVTKNFDGDLLTEVAEPTPDRLFSRTVDSISAEVEFDPQPLVAGQFGHLTFHLRDAETSKPVEDLQPYLGAFGHTLIMSADLAHAVHSHPTLEPTSDIARGLGGPQVTFEGYLPTPGVYRAWTQFQRNGRVSTFEFTFEVLSIDDAFPIRLATTRASALRTVAPMAMCVD